MVMNAVAVGVSEERTPTHRNIVGRFRVSKPPCLTKRRSFKRGIADANPPYGTMGRRIAENRQAIHSVVAIEGFPMESTLSILTA